MIMSLQLRMRLADQPDHTRVRHSGRPSPRPTRPPPSPPPPLTQYPFPPRSLVRGGQTSPHKHRLVVSHSTCPPLSPSPTRGKSEGKRGTLKIQEEDTREVPGRLRSRQGASLKPEESEG